MRAEELDNLTDRQLQQKANECFLQAENTNINKAGGEAERLRLQLDAQYYLTLVVRKRDERTARRDFRMEVGVIVLIGFEIILSFIFGWYGLREGKQEGSVLQHMDQSAAATAKTMVDLQKAQSDSLQTLKDTLGKTTEQTRLLAEAQRNLRAQLNLANREFETQNKRPVLQLRAVLYQRVSNNLVITTEVFKPHKTIEMNLLSISDTDRAADFVLRNVGKADAVNIDIRPQLYPGYKVRVRCIEFAPLTTCSTSSIALTIPARPNNRPEFSGLLGRLTPDFDEDFDVFVRIILDVPKGTTIFGLFFSVGADGVIPTRYDVLCHNPFPSAGSTR